MSVVEIQLKQIFKPNRHNLTCYLIGYTKVLTNHFLFSTAHPNCLSTVQSFQLVRLMYIIRLLQIIRSAFIFPPTCTRLSLPIFTPIFLSLPAHACGGSGKIRVVEDFLLATAQPRLCGLKEKVKEKVTEKVTETNLRTLAEAAER